MSILHKHFDKWACAYVWATIQEQEIFKLKQWHFEYALIPPQLKDPNTPLQFAPRKFFLSPMSASMCEIIHR